MHLNLTIGMIEIKIMNVIMLAYENFICDKCNYHTCIVLTEYCDSITVRCNRCLNVTTMEFEEE
jgi:hypothetical protein